MGKTTYRIQPEELPSGLRPYPFYVNEKGMVGRQNFWKGRVHRMICFTETVEPLKEDEYFVSWEEAADDPSQVIGMYLVTSDNEGNWITHPYPIAELTLSKDAD